MTTAWCVRNATVLITALICSAALALPEVIDRPSMARARAAQSLLLSVTRAGNRLVAAGERGIVLLSDDNGKSWRQARVPVSVTLTSVRFVDAREGWATGHGGVLLQTDDGGETWSKRFDGVELARLVLQAETAKGATADPVQLADAQRLVAEGPDKPLLDVCFLTPRLGFVAGAYGLFLRTDDGGKTWAPWQARLPNLQGRHLTQMAAAEGAFYVVGEQGRAYLSTDGGNGFLELKSPYRGTFFGVAALADGAALIYGLRGKVFRVAARGSDWTKLATPGSVSYAAAVRLASGDLLVASQTGELLRSADGGASLVPVELPIHTLTAALAQAADGALIVAGRGLSRLSLAGSLGDAR